MYLRQYKCWRDLVVTPCTVRSARETRQSGVKMFQPGLDAEFMLTAFSSVSTESLGVRGDHLNISAILYCFMWGKLYIIVILRD